MTGVLIFNKYYTDSGVEYVRERLANLFGKSGVSITCPKLYYGQEIDKKYDFAVFWDKDTTLCSYLESKGIRVYNSSKTISICDDKQKTYQLLQNTNGINLIDSIYSPLMYDVNDKTDSYFLDETAKKLSYPIVVKQNIGSQGRQVFLAQNRVELEKIYQELKHTRHIYQRFSGSKKGEDTRVFVIGKKAVAAVKRTNTTSFKSNVSLGGKMEVITLTKELINMAEIIAKKLNLEYGSVDFIEDKFLEANSCAYMQSAENLGIELGKGLVDYIINNLKGAV